MNGSSIPFVILLCCASIVSASTVDLRVGDAYVRTSNDSTKWTIGTGAVSMAFEYRSECLLLTSFENTLPNSPVEYANPTSATPAFALRTDGSTTARWVLESADARQVSAGGRPAAQLDLTLRQDCVRAYFHMLAFPGTSILRQWCEIENNGTSPLPLKKVSWSIIMRGGSSSYSDNWFGDSGGIASHSSMVSALITDTYHRNMEGHKTLDNVPWIALQRKSGDHDGWFMMYEYLGAWEIGVDRNGGGPITLSALMKDLNSVELEPGERLGLPVTTLGVFAGDFDDMSQRVYDWQYQYLWDYTHDDWYARMLFCGSDYYLNALNSQENFAGRIGWLDMGTADLMRSLGMEVLWDDASWSLTFADNREGPDFAQTQRYLAKMGMKWALWFAGRPPVGMLDNKVGAWGNYQWRTDGVGEFGPRADRQWREQLVHFLETNPRSSFHTCDGGSSYSHTFDIQRYADVNYFSDAGRPAQSNHYLSYLETPDKWLDIITVFNIIRSVENTGKYDPYSYAGILSMAPSWITPGPTADAADPDRIRRITDIYRYLRDQGVAGRWSYMLHPTVSGDAEQFCSQRLSHDHEKALIILKHKCPDGTVIFPKGLLPKRLYTIGYESHKTTTIRTGADLMKNGLSIGNQAPGELIYLGLPKRPGSGTDNIAPESPSRVFFRSETNLGRPGIGIYWSPGWDENWISYYEVRRGRKALGRVATGTYYFDYSPGWDVGMDYSIRTIDGDGNASGWVIAQKINGEPFSCSVLAAHSSEKGFGGWSAEVTTDGRTFTDMSFVYPARRPFIDFAPAFNATVDQPGGFEGYWEAAGTARVGRGWQQASREAACVRSWVAPKSGTIRIVGRAKKEYFRRAKGGPLRVHIIHGESIIWPVGGWALIGVPGSIDQTHDFTIQVAKGDIIRFVLDRGTSPDDDIIAWMPGIAYIDESPTVAVENTVRILCGSKSPYTDSTGNVWSTDRFYNGGKPISTRVTVDDATPSLQDQVLYQFGRQGKDFTYSIPLTPGLYTLRLKFAESKQEWFFERPINLSINGSQALQNFDICHAAGGPRRAFERVFRYLVPNADGNLVLHFTGGESPLQKTVQALVQAIEVLPEIRSTVRMDCGSVSEFVDWNGFVWGADRDYEDGHTISSESSVIQASPTVYDHGLYQTARCGKSFAYKVSVSPGLYAVHLKFAELWLGEQGQRPMNIEVNGLTVRESWDPAAAAGQIGAAADIRVEDVSPGSDGKITIRLTAVGPNEAILQGIEVE